MDKPRQARWAGLADPADAASERETVLAVAGLSKKYSPGFRRGLRYGLADIGRELIGRRASGELRPGEFWALDDVSFSLKRGEALAVVGHNGAGKTTLLRLLGGLVKPDRGEIRLRGRARALLELGVGFDPRLSARENIRLGGAVHGLAPRDVGRLVEEVIDFAELEEFADAPVQNYSSGMRSRLAYALTAQLDPDVLLVDEVLAVGDHSFQRKCVAHMLSYIANGGALLLVSHSAHHIQGVCQRAILLHHGRIAFAGGAAETLHEMFELQKPKGGEAEATSFAAGPLTVTSTEISNPTADRLYPGEPMRIALRYRCEEPSTVRWGFTIWTGDQWVCITGAGTPRGRRIVPGTGELACTLPSLPLLPGSYRMRVNLVDARSTIPLLPSGADSSWIDFDVAALADPEINVRRQIGQLVLTAVEWE